MTFQSLQNHFIIAMPALGDPNFNETVTYICKHDAEGAVGIVVNRPGDLTLGEIFAQFDIETLDRNLADQLVLAGGPVEPQRGFVLHQSQTEYESTVVIENDVKLTGSRDILVAMATGAGPEKAVLALGYAGWQAGQLEAELAANAWLSAEATTEIIFDIPFEKRRQAAADLIGVDINSLSSYAGHA
jgi:putative transcriptional regulator